MELPPLSFLYSNTTTYSTKIFIQWKYATCSSLYLRPYLIPQNTFLTLISDNEQCKCLVYIKKKIYAKYILKYIYIIFNIVLILLGNTTLLV